MPIISVDAHRDRDDNGRTPYRVRYLRQRDAGTWSYMKTRKGTIRKFASLQAACTAARNIQDD